MHTNSNPRLNKCQKAGNHKPKPLNFGRKSKIQNQTMEDILAEIKQQPSITLKEL